jgi:hypothetical protein
VVGGMAGCAGPTKVIPREGGGSDSEPAVGAPAKEPVRLSVMNRAKRLPSLDRRRFTPL